jgi:mono/diheme cytochrome c family protein
MRRTFFFARLGLAALPALAVQAGAASAQDLAYAAGIFKERCAACHGPEGAGDGPVAELLKTPPKNLRRLAQENEGRYPFERVYAVIDGRDPVPGHGTTAMPVWGNYFRAEALTEAQRSMIDPEELVQARILALVYYLQTLQE